MKPYNPINERIKYEYFQYFVTAGKKSLKTLEQARKSIVEFEKHTSFMPFEGFNRDIAINYRKYLTERKGKRSGELIKVTTLRNLITPLITFLRWYVSQRHFKSKINLTDIDYLELSHNEQHALITTDYKRFPTPEILVKIISNYPQETDMQRRDVAMVAFTMLTAPRVEALRSLKLRHLDIKGRILKQYASDGVKTKFGNNFNTFFFPLIDPIFEKVSMQYVDYVLKDKLFNRNDPIFPKMTPILNQEQEFEHVLSKEHLEGENAIREAFKRVYEHSNVEYYHPHAIRDTLMQIAYDNNLNTNDMMAWSANFGHKNVNISLRSYGGRMNDNDRQSILKALGNKAA